MSPVPPPQGPQFMQTRRTNYCMNCQQDYRDTPEVRTLHLAPCTRCGSEGHSACQH